MSSFIIRPSSGQSIIYVATPGLVNNTFSAALVIQLTFEEGTTPTNRVSNAPLAFQHIAYVPDRQIVSSFRILRKYVFEPLRQKAALVIVRSGVTTMLIPMHILEEKA